MCVCVCVYVYVCVFVCSSYVRAHSPVCVCVHVCVLFLRPGTYSRRVLENDTDGAVRTVIRRYTRSRFRSSTVEQLL